MISYKNVASNVKALTQGKNLSAKMLKVNISEKLKSFNVKALKNIWKVKFNALTLTKINLH